MAILQKDIPLWDFWSEESLRAKRDLIGARDFDRGWRQIALSDSEVVFKEQYIDECCSNKHILYYPGDDKGIFCPKGCFTFMGVDLAIAAKSASGDYFVITGIMVDPKTKHRTLVTLYRNRGLTFNQQLQMVENYADFLDPTYIYVENNAYQQAFVQELTRTTALPVEPFTTTAIKKTDLEFGLPRLAIEIEHLRWTFPVGNKISRETTEILLQELKTYPLGRHDDVLMSCWFARAAASHIESRVEKTIYII